MRNRYKIILLIIGWSLIALLIARVGVTNFFAGLVSADLWSIVSGLLIIVAAQFVRSMKWRMLFPKQLSALHALQSYMAVLSFSSFSPLRIADLTMSLSLKDQQGVAYKKSVTLLFLEKIIDFSVMFIAAIPAIVLFVGWGNFFTIGMYALLGLAIGLLLFVTLYTKITQFFLSVRHCISTRILVGLLGLSGTAFMMEIYGGYLMVQAFFSLDFAIYGMIKPLSLIAGVLSFVPAGIGTESLSAIYLFAQRGYDDPTLTTGIVASRLLAMMSIIVIGQGFLLFGRKHFFTSDRNVH